MKSKMAANNMANIRVSPHVLSTLMSLRRITYKNYNNKLRKASPEAVVGCSVKKLLLKLTQNSQETPVLESLFSTVAT